MSIGQEVVVPKCYCKRPGLTRSSGAILFDVLDAEAITEYAVGPPAINTNQSIETKKSILYNSSQRSRVRLLQLNVLNLIPF